MTLNKLVRTENRHDAMNQKSSDRVYSPCVIIFYLQWTYCTTEYNLATKMAGLQKSQLVYRAGRQSKRHRPSKEIDIKTTVEGHSVERMYLRQRCSDGSVNKTILKPARLAAAPGRQYVYVGFSRRKIPRSSHTISEFQFRHPDCDLDRAQKLISLSVSRHLSTRNILSKSMHAFLSNLANRQTDRQTNEHGEKHLLPSLVEVKNKE